MVIAKVPQSSEDYFVHGERAEEAAAAFEQHLLYKLHCFEDACTSEEIDAARTAAEQQYGVKFAARTAYDHLVDVRDQLDDVHDKLIGAMTLAHNEKIYFGTDVFDALHALCKQVNALLDATAPKYVRLEVLWKDYKDYTEEGTK